MILRKHNKRGNCHAFRNRHLSRELKLAKEERRFVLAAWGAHGGHRARDFHVLHRLVDGVEWRCLGRTHQGHPKHPLYVPKSQQMVPFVGRAK